MRDLTVEEPERNRAASRVSHLDRLESFCALALGPPRGGGQFTTQRAKAAEFEGEVATGMSGLHG